MISRKQYQYYQTKKVLEQVRRDVRQQLNELKLEDYRNPMLQQLTLRVAGEIIDTAKQDTALNGTVSYYEDSQLVGSEDCTVIDFPVTTIDWLKLLKVCVVYNAPQDDMMVVSDSAVYNDETEINTSYTVKKFVGNEEMTYLVDKDCIRIATILVYLQKDSEKLQNVRLLASAIFHELSHLYDMFSEEKTSADLNLENTMAASVELRTPPDVYNIFFDDPQTALKDAVANADMIQQFMMDEGLYMCQRSELTARLCNFVHEIDNYTYKQIKQTPLERLSGTYATMKKFEGYFQAFIDYTPDALKKAYVQKFIISVWDKPMKDRRLIFGRNFQVDGKYSVRSFDAFFRYFIERLDDLFFKRCDQLVSDLDESLHEIFVCYKASKQSLLQTSVAHHQNQQQLNEQARNYLHLYIHGYKLCDILEYHQKVAWAFL